MKKLLTNNFSIKIISLILAVLFWGLIVNIYDPSTEVTIAGVNVSLINIESLTDKNYSYELVDGSKISVYIKGPKSVITDIKASDIVAVADVSTMSEFSEYVDISVKVVKNGKQVKNIEVIPRTTVVKLDIENRLTKEVEVVPVAINSPSDGHTVTNITLENTSVKIAGPSSAIEAVSEVRALCDVASATSNVSGVAELVMIDKDGNQINDTLASLSIAGIEFNATIEGEKTIWIAVAEPSGKVKDGAKIMKTSLSASKLEIMGNDQALAQIDGITIPSSAINIDGADTSKKFTISLSDYLPNGVRTKSINKVTVTVTISDNDSINLSIPTDSIKFNNLSDGLEAKIKDEDALNILVTSDSIAASDIKVSDITASVNLTGLVEGQHSVFVSFTMPEGVKLKESYKVPVIISKKTQEDQTKTSTSTETQAIASSESGR